MNYRVRIEVKGKDLAGELLVSEFATTHLASRVGAAMAEGIAQHFDLPEGNVWFNIEYSDSEAFKEIDHRSAGDEDDATEQS